MHVPPKRDCGDYSVGAHLFPFRTEKLSPIAPMVLPYRWESRSSPNTIARFIRTGLFCFKSRQRKHQQSPTSIPFGHPALTSPRSIDRPNGTSRPQVPALASPRSIDRPNGTSNPPVRYLPENQTHRPPPQTAAKYRILNAILIKH